MTGARGPWLLSLLLLGGCVGNPSALNPAGPGARLLADLTWLFVAACGAIYLAVLLVMALAFRRGMKRGGDPTPVAHVAPTQDRRKLVLIGLALTGTVLVLSVFVGASFATDRALLSLQRRATVEVSLTAHQWWWEIRYQNPTPSNVVITANELHLPLDEPVKISLSSLDVIHSFWVPNLTGKQDIIPSRDNTIWITATQPGEWRGRCAEFCGYQHAHMELLVVVEPREAFDRWRAAQAAPSAAPETAEERRGQVVFNQAPCILCHVIRGSTAMGYSSTAPDLTHLKSRKTIAAGTLPNTKGYLGGWIVDPQSHKPGTLMPVNLLPPEDFQALLSYLEILR